MNDKLFSALLALLLSVSAVNAMSDTSAARPDWQLLSTTEDPDKTISWYVDATSIVHEDDYLRAYLRTSWSVPQFGPDQTPYQSSTYLNYFDCDTGRIAYTGNRYFVGTEPEGQPIHQEAETPLDKLKFQRVVPGSAGASRLEFVCKFRSKNFRT